MSKLLHNFEDQSKSTISADFAIEQDGNRYIPKSLLVTLDATHAGYKNKNFFYYDPDAMRYAVSRDVWTTPYSKPFLKNHDLDSEPLGRVKAARFIDSTEGAGFTQLDVLVTDSDAIEKIIDGRYLTVSTHGAPLRDAASDFNFTQCSICNINLNVEEYCGHSRGRIYEDDEGIEKQCYWRVGALDYKEVSLVNTPADNDGTTAAQITSISMVDGERPADPCVGDECKVQTSLVFVDSDVRYADESFLLACDLLAELLVANRVLWESVKYDKQAYIDKKGLVYDEDLVLSRLEEDELNKIKDEDECEKLLSLTDIDWDELEALLDEEMGDAKLSSSQRKKLKSSTFCGPGRSFPVPDCAHVTAARRLIGRYKGDGSKSAILACVSRKANQLGCKSSKKDAENVQNLKNTKPDTPLVIKDDSKMEDSSNDKEKNYYDASSKQHQHNEKADEQIQIDLIFESLTDITLLTGNKAMKLNDLTLEKLQQSIDGASNKKLDRIKLLIENNSKVSDDVKQAFLQAIEAAIQSEIAKEDAANDTESTNKNSPADLVEALKVEGMGAYIASLKDESFKDGYKLGYEEASVAISLETSSEDEAEEKDLEVDNSKEDSKEDSKEEPTQEENTPEGEQNTQDAEADKKEIENSIKKILIDTIVHSVTALRKSEIDLEDIETSQKSYRATLEDKDLDELRDLYKELEKDMLTAFVNVPTESLEKETLSEDKPQGLDNDEKPMSDTKKIISSYFKSK